MTLATHLKRARIKGVGCQLPEELAGHLEYMAEVENVSQSDIIRRALAEYFANHRRPPKPRGRKLRMPLGRLLRELRGPRTQTEIAALCGVDGALMCRYESGRLPTWERLTDLAKALGVNRTMLEKAWRR